jgi:hypothetical protein
MEIGGIDLRGKNRGEKLDSQIYEQEEIDSVKEKGEKKS